MAETFMDKKRKDLTIYGLSHPDGILFTDMNTEEKTSVYVFQKDGEIVSSKGSYDEMYALWDKDRGLLVKPGWELKYMGMEVLLLILGFIVLTRFHPGMIGYLGYLLFAVLEFKPLLSLMMLGHNSFVKREDFIKMKRMHGAEHTLIDYVMRTPDDRRWEMDSIRSCSRIADNCGGVAAAERFLLGFFPALAVGLIPHLGFLKALLLFICGEAAVFIGSGLNHPILKLFQLPNVAKPGERELRLAAAGIRELLKEGES